MQADEQALALAVNPNASEDIAAQQALVAQAQETVKTAARPFVDSDLASAQAAVDAAQANLDVARVNQQLTQVFAPFDGLVSARLLAEGALASTTVPIFTLVSNEVEVNLPVAQDQLSMIKPNQSAQLSSPALGNQSVDAKIAGISPAADPRSRTFLVRVVPVVQDGKLMPGMSASVSIATLEKADALLIPRDAVATDSSGKQGVYVVQNGPNGQIATFKTPTLGASDGKNVEVIDGLNAGDVVIVSGQTSISNNQAVRTAGQGAGGASGKPQAAASGKPQASESAKPQAS
jgi:RND family efflux transporter MFP subunit